jgi:hypothetical protein
MHKLTLRIALLIASVPAFADGKLSATVGLDYSNGKYGTTETTQIWSLPLAVKYEFGNLTMKASVPWLDVKSPSGSSLGPDGRPVEGGAGRRVTETGIGDLVTSLAWAAYDDARTGIAVDLTGKIKWGTADKDKGLGTGENDYSAQVDIYKTIGDNAVFATLGYKVYGDPVGIDFRDVPYAGMGLTGRLSEGLSAGVSWDYRPKVTRSGAPTNELTGFFTRKLGASSKLQVYLVRGFADGSPDWGGGITLTHTY